MFQLTKQEWLMLLGISVVFLILRIPSFFDPWWYGDENIYMAVGQGMARGQWLYTEVWDNKPPLIYLIYAFSYTIFGSALWPLKVFNGLLGILGVFAFYLTARKIFDLGLRISVVSTGIFALIFATSLEGSIVNAENIFMPLVWVGFFLLVYQLHQYLEKNEFSWAWVALGSTCWSLAALTKIPAVLEIGMLGLILLVAWLKKSVKLDELRSNKDNSILREHYTSTQPSAFLLSLIRGLGGKFWKFFGTIGLVVSLPYLALVLVYALQGNLDQLLFSLVGFGGDYIESGKDPIVFGVSLSFISGTMLRAILLLMILVTSTWLFWRDQISRNWFILLNWLTVGIFAVLLSERNYPHYLLQILPVFILAGMMVWNLVTNREFIWQLRLTTGLLAILILQTFLTTFTGGTFFWNYYSPQHYYGGFGQVVVGQRSLESWRADYNEELITTQSILVQNIQELTEPEDKVYVVANRPDLYFLSGRLSGQKFVADYHYSKEDIPEMFETIKSNDTELILIDGRSDKAEAFYAIIQGDYVLRDEVLDEYTFWIRK